MTTTTTAPTRPRLQRPTAPPTADSQPAATSPELDAMRQLYALTLKIYAQTKTLAAQLDQLAEQAENPPPIFQQEAAAPSFLALQVVAETLRKPGKPAAIYYKILGEAPFHQWGVRIWPEILAQAGIDAASVTEETPHTLPPGTRATYQESPKKITAIIYP